MSKITTHAECKDSGAEWLGSVPKHWDIVKFRHHFQESPEKISNEVVGVMLSVSGYRGIEIKQYDDEIRRRSLADLLNYRIVRPSQLVVNSMWLNAAGLGVSSFEGHVSPAYRSYWISDAFCLRYVHHLLRSSVYVDFYTSRVQGIRPNSLQLGRRDLMNLMVLLPPKDEQKQIAAFLDFETAKIDALIEKQQQLIALLGEKRQAVISHAVTKGLNPDAPMRDSGVDWLGEVPSHWTVTRLKYIASIKGRIGFRGYTTADQVGEGEGALVLGASEIAPDGALRFHSPSYLSWEKYWESPEIMVRRNDIVVVQRGATTGKVGLVDEELGHTTINPSLILVRTPAEVGGYVFRFLTCDAARSAFEVETSQTTIPMMSQEELGNTFVLLPPEKERFDIAAYLDSSLSRIDELTARQHSLAELLRERRTALISAAVTGKIDVRGWKRPSADSTLETEMEVTGS